MKSRTNGKPNLTVKEIVKAYLILNAFDGLYREECCCETDDLMPCNGETEDCEAGYKVDCNCGEHCLFHVARRKVSQVCAEENVQDCHRCERIDCGDNDKHYSKVKPQAGKEIDK